MMFILPVGGSIIPARGNGSTERRELGFEARYDVRRKLNASPAFDGTDEPDAAG